MDTNKIESLTEQLLIALGENPKREGLKETPKRVAKAYTETLSGYQKMAGEVMKTFKGDGYDEMVVCRDIEFYSFCEHHMLPFYGKVHVAYIPDKKIIGLSKLARVADIFSKRLQVQERMTQQIAEALMRYLKPKGVGVVVEGKHLCMMMRGVQKQNSSMVTSSMLGAFRKNHATREEFLKLINGK